MEPDTFECCQQISPCEALCLLEQMQLDLLLGRKNRSYRVGDEQFNLAIPTIAELETAIELYRKRCNLSQGKTSKRRARVCFVFGSHNCRHCGSANCGCR